MASTAGSSPLPAFPQGRRHDFHDLMRHRVMEVLLVSSPYDWFLLEEAGQISERMRGEFRNLDLHYGPGLTPATSGRAALELAREGRFRDPRRVLGDRGTVVRLVRATA